ncbi:MAG: tetratricopeptide repeat protein [Candidatus Poribacteria bacterium]|nr:tetratricopeptide repeat protein [Candidatus Poribacteria bacterium]
MKLLFLLLYCGTLCFLPFAPSPAHSQDFNADNLLRFAESLFREGDYLNAVHEYKRYRFLYPDTDDSAFVQLHIAASYQNLGQLSAAIEAYQALMETYPDSRFVERARSNIAQCQLLQGDDGAAIASLRQFLSEYPESNLAPRAQFIIATIYMDEKDWASAAREWQQVQIRYPETSFGEMSDRLAPMVQYGESLPRRSPTLAGVLSTVVPGLGQTYSGRFSDGFYSLLVVGATAGGTAYYIDKERYGVAIPVGIVSLFFYLGNIYSSVQAAKVFNQQQISHFLDGLRTQIYESNLFGALNQPPTAIPLVLWQSRF